MARKTAAEQNIRTGRAATTARQYARDMVHNCIDRGRATPEGAQPGLAPGDDAFARRLARMTIRHVGEIDHLLSQLMDRPLPDRDGLTRNALRIGLCELLFMETADHAATDEAVRLAPPKHTGLVNAVLRNFVRRRKDLVFPTRMAVNIPAWLYTGWETSLGRDLANDIAAQLTTDPPLDLTIREAPDDWAEKLGGVRIGASTVRVPVGNAVTLIEGYKEGAWWVQDAAAALPVALLGPISGKTIYDLCAAPGGKTAQMVAAGASVTALDRSDRRLARLEKNLERLGLETVLVNEDAAEWKPDAPADAVLLDAPCSATGTLRRHPDVAWTKRPEDVKSLQEVQKRLLASAAGIVTREGVLLYCVCSLQPEEGPEIIADFLAGNPGWQIDPVSSEEAPDFATAITPEGTVRTHPGILADKGGVDGFYICRLKQIA